MSDKVLEYRYLNHALRLMGLHPEGTVDPCETPDFLVTLAGATVGIEVTAFYLPEPASPQPHQARVRMQQVAVEQARRVFRERGGPALYVTVYFAADRPLSKQRAHELGPLLANAMAAAPLPASIQDGWARVNSGLPPEIHSLSIAASVNTSDELWHPAVSGWVAPVERAHIKAEIARKAKRLSVIRQKCAAAWLLIVNDAFRGGAVCEISADARAFQFNSPFDMTLWLESSSVYDLCKPGSVSRG